MREGDDVHFEHYAEVTSEERDWRGEDVKVVLEKIERLGDEPSMEANSIEVVKKTWRVMSKRSCEKKYCSTTWNQETNWSDATFDATAMEALTSRHTNSSKGSVVNMLRPKQNRAMLINVSSFQSKPTSEPHSKDMYADQHIPSRNYSKYSPASYP